jgi:hypothetical protein
LHACAAKAVKARGDSLIKALASLGFGNDKFVKRRFAALAHAEIVAAVIAAWAGLERRRVEGQYGIEDSSRYSIIADAATNFRVWSLKMPHGSIALRVTKLR